MIEFQVEGMSCQHCVGAVTKAIRGLDAAAQVEVNLDDARVRVHSSASTEQLGSAIAEAGYAVTGSRTIVDA
ncbi:heavy-metal-associated domain-containing protein [Trinickia sp.]|uniref:heavy-metal-associated domain-containing protein n=1 Tax=Trinickia sp. TaxID=2571163 RepID=UPI003F80A138